MKLDRFLRLTIALIIFLVFVIAIAAMLFLTESALNVWDRLVQGPPAVLYGYVAFMVALLLAAMWLVYRLLVRRKPASDRARQKPLRKQDIEGRLRDAESSGVDVSSAREELRELAARQSAKAVHLCFFGEVSTGKSSLIKALIPDAEVEINAVGGSTVEIRHYRWRSSDGTEVLLTDMPGTGGHEAALDEIAEEEAQRAQVVLYVCDGDLARNEIEALRWLLALDKPLVLVMNKTDRYSADEQALLIERLLDHLDRIGGSANRDQVVAVSAGGEVDIVEQHSDGNEERVRRQRPADIGVLVVAINRLLGSDLAVLDEKRDRAVFRLTAEKLAQAERQYRQQRAEQIIRNSTRKAVIGALAAVSPGTDVLIQGYVGTSMTRQLCDLFGAAPRDLDIEEFLNLSQSRAGKALPLSLAVAGNGLKAFPGAGTVAGGLVHAVAYGLIFDALGRSLVLTLKKHGELDPAVAVQEFEDEMDEHIEAGVLKIARMAVEQGKKPR